MEDKNEPLASEIYKDLKASIAFKEKVIIWLSIIIALLVVALAGDKHMAHLSVEPV